MEPAGTSKHGSGTSASSAADRSTPLDEKLPAEVTSDEFCRICLLKSVDLKPLMDRVDGVMIPEMLYKLCGRQIEVQDGYPRSICQRCFCKLDCAFRFLNEFQKQDERLRSFYWSGSVAKRLQEYQAEGDATVRNRMDELIARHEHLFTKPAKEVCHKETNTLKQKKPKMVDVGMVTEKETINLQLVKTEEESDNDILLEHYVMEEESEETYLDYSMDSEGSTLKDEQMVEMKIDLLQSGDEAESYSDEKPASSQVSKRIKGDPQTQRRTVTRVKLAPVDAVDESSIPTDTDDQTMEPVYYEDSATDMEDEEESSFDAFFCYICEAREESEALLEQHLDLHSTMLPYDCKSCVAHGVQIRTIKTVSSLHNHFRSHHYPYWCKICGKRFLRKVQLKNHMENHSNSLYTCDECGRGFTHKKTWQNHLKRHKALREEVYKCTTCSKTFGNKARLDRHLRLHTGDRPYECKYCDKRYYDRHQLQCHTEKHFRDMDCTCEYCGETFAGTKKLDAHKVAKHLTGKDREEFLALRAKRAKRPAVLKEEHQTCPYQDCTYTAKTYGAMYVHKRTKHQPMHRCDYCNKSFAFLNQCQSHMKLHTGEKPFQCEVCGRSFRRGFSYREHMEMHTSELNYNCPTCNKSFKRPRYLQAHMLTHTAERKFSCEMCGNSYKTNGELKKHNKNKHGLDILEQDVVIETDEQSFIVEYV